MELTLNIHIRIDPDMLHFSYQKLCVCFWRVSSKSCLVMYCLKLICIRVENSVQLYIMSIRIATVDILMQSHRFLSSITYWGKICIHSHKTWSSENAMYLIRPVFICGRVSVYSTGCASIDVKPFFIVVAHFRSLVT